MNDDRKQDAEREVDDQETDNAEGGDKNQQGSTDSGAAPADDDIIIK
jgi:hypothetical protein